MFLSVSVPLPKRLVDALEANGLSVIDVIFAVLGNKLDPGVVAEARIGLAEKFLDEAREYIANGDAIQASEKLYKVAEECVKALAEVLRVPEAEEAWKSRRWYTWLLGGAARSIANKLSKPEVVEAWALAYDVRVWGFHEAKYTVDKVSWGLKYFEKLLDIAKSVIKDFLKRCEEDTKFKL